MGYMMYVCAHAHMHVSVHVGVCVCVGVCLLVGWALGLNSLGRQERRYTSRQQLWKCGQLV